MMGLLGELSHDEDPHTSALTTFRSCQAQYPLPMWVGAAVIGRSHHPAHRWGQGQEGRVSAGLRRGHLLWHNRVHQHWGHESCRVREGG